MPDIVKLIFKDNYVQLELDNSEKLKISFDAYSMYKLSSGTTLTAECYMEIYEESRKFECMEKAFNQLAVRGRSVDELRQYLKKKNFSGKHIEETLDYLKEKGYLNDFDFSMSFVKGKMKSGKSGKDIIVRDLYRKGVGRKIIDKVMKESGADVTDEDALYELAMKKYRSVKDKENSFMKVSNFLRGRGFDYESIGKVLRRIKSGFEE
jgi:regulatory protein